MDGLDELDSEKQILLIRSLLRLSLRLSTLRLVVMSRPLESGFEEWSAAFRFAHLLPFSEDDVYRFGERWLSGESGWVLEKLAEMVQNSPRVRDLLRIPLFLELSLFVVHRLGEAGSSRKNLLEESVDQLLEGSSRRRRRPASRLTQKEERIVLTRLAGLLESTKQVVLSRDNLLEAMRDYLRLEREYSSPQADELAARFLEDFLYRNSLIRFSGSGYSFLHKAFQDYFVAEGLSLDREGAFQDRISDGESAEVCLLLLHGMAEPTTHLLKAYRSKVASHARVTANAVLDGVPFDFGKKKFQKLILDVLGEDGIQEARFQVLSRCLGELPDREGRILIREVERLYQKRPEILAVVSEVKRSAESQRVSTIGPSVGTKVREIHVIAESQAPTRALAEFLKSPEGAAPFRIQLDLYDAVEATQRVADDLMSGSVATYDVVVQPHRRLGWLATQGLIQPVNRFLASSGGGAGGNASASKTVFQDWWKEMSWYGGLCYGFPLVALTMYLWVRQDLLEDENLQASYQAEHLSPLRFPRTPQEFRRLAQFFGKCEAVPHGLVLQGRSRVRHEDSQIFHPSLYHEWLNFLYAFGGRVLEQEFGWEYGPIIVNSAESIESLEFYASLYDHAFCHPKSFDFTWDNLPKVMASGEAAMCVMWNDAVYEVARKRDSRKFSFGIVPAVSGARATQSDGWSMLVPSRARDAEASYAFMEWILQESIQVQLQRSGGASPVRSVYSDPVVKELPYTDVSLAAMETRVPRETIPESEAIWQVITEELEKVIRSETTARSALNNAARRLEEEVLAGKTARRFVD